MAECIFCRIVRGEISCDKVYDSGQVVAFKDRNPKAPVHVLVVPRQHIETINDLPRHPELAAEILNAIASVARACGIAESGFRVIGNANRDGGQEVPHVHFHLLGGRQLGAMVSDAS